MEFLPAFIASQIERNAEQERIKAARDGFADWRQVETEYLRVRTDNPNITPKQAFEIAYDAALNAAKERVA